MSQLNFKKIGEGQPLLILHGLLGSLDNWLTLGKQFSEIGFKVFLIDQRNHGKSFHNDIHSYESMAEDLNNFIQDYMIEDPIILGHSMGGKTVMRFANDFPNVARKLIVADISPRFYPPHHQEILEGLNAIDVDKLPSRQEADQILGNYVLGFGERQFLLKNLDRTPHGFQWKCNLKAITDQISNVGEAQEFQSPIDLPTLFIRGDRSDYIQKDDLKLIQQQFSQAEIMTIANSGHWVHAEQPKEFFEIVKDFIQ